MRTCVWIGVALGLLASVRAVLPAMPMPLVASSSPTLLYAAVGIALSARGLRRGGLRPLSTVGVLLGLVPFVMWAAGTAVTAGA